MCRYHADGAAVTNRAPAGLDPLEGQPADDLHHRDVPDARATEA